MVMQIRAKQSVKLATVCFAALAGVNLAAALKQSVGREIFPGEESSSCLQTTGTRENP